MIQQLEFKFMEDLLTPRELLFRALEREVQRDADLWFIEYFTKLKV